MATWMASCDCEGQSELINGTMLRDKKKTKTQIKSQLTLLVTFIPALPKKSVLCVFACFLCLSLSHVLCKPVMTVVHACRWGRKTNAFFFFNSIG